MRRIHLLGVLALVVLLGSLTVRLATSLAATPGFQPARQSLTRDTESPAHWYPRPGTTWYWQLQQNTGAINLKMPVQVYDIDGFDNSAATVTRLHQRGVKVVCYIDAGTWESWRPDAGRFPRSVLGKSNGWPGERWLDIRRLSILEPIMMRRFKLCQSIGFDAIEPDNIDGYNNDTGFPLTAQEQITYNTWLAHEAHRLGLSIALKNDPDQVGSLLASFDFSLDEECFRYAECSKLTPFIAAGKAVFEVEYNRAPPCRKVRSMRFSAVWANLALDGKRWVPCW